METRPKLGLPAIKWPRVSHRRRDIGATALPHCTAASTQGAGSETCASVGMARHTCFKYSSDQACL